MLLKISIKLKYSQKLCSGHSKPRQKLECATIWRTCSSIDIVEPDSWYKRRCWPERDCSSTSSLFGSRSFCHFWFDYNLYSWSQNRLNLARFRPTNEEHGPQQKMAYERASVAVWAAQWAKTATLGPQEPILTASRLSATLWSCDLAPSFSISFWWKNGSVTKSNENLGILEEEEEPWVAGVRQQRLRASSISCASRCGWFPV